MRARGLSGYIVVVAGAAGTRAISFTATVMIAHELGPSGFGEFTLFFALMVPFISATDFLDIIYVRYVNTPGELRSVEYLRAAVTLKFFAIALLIVFAYPIAVVLARFVFLDSDLTSVLTMGIITGVLIGWISLLASTFLARERYALFGLINSLFYLTIFLALIPFLASGHGLSTTTVYLIFLSASIVVGVGSLASLVHSAWPVRPPRQAIRATLSFAKWLVIAQVSYVAFQRVDVMLLSRYVEIDEVGQFGAALRITVMVSLMIGSMSSFLLPRAARSRGSRLRMRDYLWEGAYLAGGLCVGVLILWIATPWIVSTFLGAGFEPATHLARILLLGVAFLAIATPLVQLLLSDDRPLHVPLYLLSKYSVLAAGTVILAPRFGATGAAWAFATSEAVGALYAGVIVLIRWLAVAGRVESHAAS